LNLSLFVSGTLYSYLQVFPFKSLIIAVAPALCQVGPYVIRGGQIGIETCISLSTPVSLCKDGSTDCAHAFFI